MDAPRHIDVRQELGLRVEWSDGTASEYTAAHLRRMSPSAEARELREQLARNPLTILPAARRPAPDASLTITGAELVGNYAIRLRFSDGHDTGIYTWDYLRQLGADDPSAGGTRGRAAPRPLASEPGQGPPSGS